MCRVALRPERENETRRDGGPRWRGQSGRNPRPRLQEPGTPRERCRGDGLLRGGLCCPLSTLTSRRKTPRHAVVTDASPGAGLRDEMPPAL